MRYLASFFTLVLTLNSTMTMADPVIEKPMFNLVSGIPENQNVVGGYVSFGVFRDGLPAIQLVGVGVAQFFEREVQPESFGLKEYTRWEIHCSTGARRITGNNDANNIRNMARWEIRKCTQSPKGINVINLFIAPFVKRSTPGELEITHGNFLLFGVWPLLSAIPKYFLLPKK